MKIYWEKHLIRDPPELYIKSRQEEETKMWRKSYYAARGRGHKEKGIPCQDKVWYRSSCGAQVVALADGAGSARWSHYGAEETVKRITRQLAAHFEEFYACEDAYEVSRRILGEIRKGLRRLAAKRKCRVEDLASTLLAVAVKDDRFLMIHLGDGAIGYLKNGIVRTASRPTNGEYVNSTVFTTSSSAARLMTLCKGPANEIDGFILMSDGTGDSLYNRKAKEVSHLAYPLFLYSGIFEGEGIVGFLENTFADVFTQVTRDDCSLAILVRDSAYHDIKALRMEDKMALYGLDRFQPGTRRRIKQYEAILELLADGKGEQETARTLYIRKEHFKRKLRHLEDCGLLRKEGKSLRLLTAK